VNLREKKSFEFFNNDLPITFELKRQKNFHGAFVGKQWANVCKKKILNFLILGS